MSTLLDKLHAMRHCGHTYTPEGMERLSVAMLCTEAANEIASLTARLAAAEQKASEGEKDKARLESARFWLSSVLAKENCNTTILDVLDELKEACESQEWFREEIDRVCDAAMRKGEG